MPTLRGLGYDVTRAMWYAVLVPAGPVPAIVAMLHRWLQAMVDDEVFKAALQKLGERPQYLHSEGSSYSWRRITRRWGRSYGRSFRSGAS